MTQPTNYTPTTDFSQQEAINASGRSTVNTAALDAEFANIETTLDQTVSNLSLIQRDDGRLKDVSVEIHTISPEVLNLIGGGYALRGLWAEATAYALNDICSNGAYTYVCRTAHTASGLFDGQYWTQFGFTSGADAAQAAAAAQGSATSAAGSATAANNSAIAAAASASSISGSVASASSYASIATTKAGDAASSATAAGNSAVSAAASAASINTTTFALKTGVGSSGTWPISISGNASTASSAANGGVTSVNGATGAVTVSNFPSGTAMLFAQAAAPTGWTKSTAHNDKALRVVSGTGGVSGGSVAFSTVFAKTASDESSLSIAQLAAHAHTTVIGASPSAGSALNPSGNYSNPASATSSVGSGSTHSHGMDIRVQYVDVIVATKD